MSPVDKERKSTNILDNARNIDLNLYELKMVYKKPETKTQENTDTNTKNFYIDGLPLVYRSDLFVTMSRKWLDGFVSLIFPKDWYAEDKELKSKFNEFCSDEKDKSENKLEKTDIDKCLKVKHTNSANSNPNTNSQKSLET